MNFLSSSAIIRLWSRSVHPQRGEGIRNVLVESRKTIHSLRQTRLDELHCLAYYGAWRWGFPLINLDEYQELSLKYQDSCTFSRLFPTFSIRSQKRHKTFSFEKCFSFIATGFITVASMLLIHSSIVRWQDSSHSNLFVCQTKFILFFLCQTKSILVFLWILPQIPTHPTLLRSHKIPQ